MKITKYEHSCIVLEQAGNKVVIDPGEYSVSLPEVQNVSGIIVTHVHSDHFNVENIKKLLTLNESAKIYTTNEVAQKLHLSAVEIANTEKVYTIGSFQVEFFGGQHALVSPEYPHAQNIAPLVNETFYYPGDSLISCPKKYSVLGAPTMGPWLKFSDSFTMLKESPANMVIPMHTGFINEAGERLYQYLFSDACSTLGKTYRWLETGESIDV